MNRTIATLAGLTAAAIVSATTPAHTQTREPEAIRIPSGQSVMFGSMFVGDGTGPRPTIIMLLGHPAWGVVGRTGAKENVLELAQPLQRAGFTVLSFNYRGSWGSAGTYGLLSRIEDVKAALAFVKSPAAARYGVDASRVTVLGHSLGGWNALIAGVEEGGLRCTVAIAPGSPGSAAVRFIDAANNPAGLEQPILGLSGYTTRDLRRESVANQPRVEVSTRFATLKGPLLIVQGKQDTAPTISESIAAYVQAARAAGVAPFEHVQIDGDHNFERNRQELASVVVGWVSKQCM